MKGKEFVPGERCFHLYYLSLTAQEIAPSLAPAWATELFSLTFRLSKTWGRSALQKNAIELVSEQDSSSALGMLNEMDVPPTGGGPLPEDLRAWASRKVFVSFLGSGGDPKRIVATARYIGDTGLYPFSAVGFALPLLPKQASEVRATLLNDSIAYLGGSSAIYNSK